jgi:hypothetical protein
MQLATRLSPEQVKRLEAEAQLPPSDD